MWVTKNEIFQENEALVNIGACTPGFACVWRERESVWRRRHLNWMYPPRKRLQGTRFWPLKVEGETRASGDVGNALYNMIVVLWVTWVVLLAFSCVDIELAILDDCSDMPWCAVVGWVAGFGAGRKWAMVVSIAPEDYQKHHLGCM